MKIENIINSCHSCRYMKKLKEIPGNTLFAAVCDYGGFDENIPLPVMLVRIGRIQDVLPNHIPIPDNCPLEEYDGKIKTK